MSNQFYVNGQFPSFMPIRATAQKVLAVVDAAIAGAANAEEKDYLAGLKEHAEAAEPSKLFYFTIKNAKLLNLV